MRKSHVIGFVIASLLTLGTIAQAQAAAPGTSQERQQRGRRFESGHGRLLGGITLSDAEKARVKGIREKHQTESRSLRESLRPAVGGVRAAGEKRASEGRKGGGGRT